MDAQRKHSSEAQFPSVGRVLILALLLSILAHVFTSVLNIPKKQDWADQDLYSPIELSDLSENQQEIAETQDAGNREIDPDAKYLSDRNQTAKEQTKSKVIDDFREGQMAGKPRATSPSEEIGQSDSSELDLAIENQDKKSGKKDWKELSLQDLGLGNGFSAATDDHLEGVDEAEQTILSTREFQYYAYYNRIKDLLRQHWKPKVHRELTKLMGKGRRLSSQELTTKVLVVLNNQGKIHKISKLGSSGIGELDGAAVLAFNQAAPFPNPPKGMIEPDGFVRVRWDFILTLESSPTIQYRNVGRLPR